MSPTPRAGTDSLPLSLAQCVDQVCDRFEAAWLAGQRPLTEDYLDATPQSVRPVLLRELLRLEVHYRARAGEQPPLAEYQRRFPAFAELIESLLRDTFPPAPAPENAAGSRETMPDPAQTGPYISQGLPAPKAPARLPAIPGYEVRGVLGQGGMGVVYEARHLKLDRPVAIKMIRGADQAGDEDLSRFLREARAVAHLQHPNIVQIHEIGEHDGLPYFSLEYVDGGSLSKHIKGKPQPPQAAAALVETLARAMNYAHQRQIVHRDLKPANILLQTLSPEAHEDTPKKPRARGSDSGKYVCSLTDDYLPKITDFGLAKQLDADLGHTQANAVMGTPSYMAPEQASGKSGESGPLADVYALGAILYELLTGRVPFKGETVLETLEQVRTQDPVPPSKLQPKVPRDLETICLKCLAKDPDRRYTSALMLAQDLERFQASEPILGRRERVAARLWRKVRRNRVVSAAVLAVIAALVVAGYFAPKAFEDRERAAIDRRVTALMADVEGGLQTPEMTEPYLKRIEALISDLDQMAPDKAAGARLRLYRLFADRIRQTFRDRLPEDEIPHIEAAIGLLNARDPILAKGVQNEYAQRRVMWEPVFELTSPFANLDKVFDSVRHRICRLQDDSLLGRIPNENNIKMNPIVWTRIATPGKAKLVTVFDRSWKTASQIRLALSYAGGKSYCFMLRIPSTSNTGIPITFEMANKTGLNAELEIYRYVNGVNPHQTLNKQSLYVADLFAGCPLNHRP